MVTTNLATDDQELITLRSADGSEFILSAAVALKSRTIKTALDGRRAGSVHLRAVKADVLAEVVEYWKMRDGYDVAAAGREGLEKLERQFFRRLRKSVLLGLLGASDYLHKKELQRAASRYVLDRICGMPVGDLRTYFDITVEAEAATKTSVQCRDSFTYR